MGRRESAVLKQLSAGEDRDLRSEYITPAIKIVLVGVAYYASGRLGLRLALVEKNVTPLWPPTGIAVVAFLVLGRGIWPGVALAAFLVNAPISSNLWAAGATAVGNTIAPLVAAELLIRTGFRKELERLRDAIAIVLLAALVSMTISASIGAGTLVASDAIPGSEFISAWAVWWTGDAMGVMVVAPFLLTLLSLRRYPKLTWKEQAEAVALLAAVTVATLAVLQTSLNLLFLVLPPIGWMAWRFQQRGVAPAALVVTGITAWAAAHSYGPFAGGSLFQKMLQLQAFNATVAFTSFVLAAVVSERLRDREALEQAAADLEERVRQRTSELSGVNDRLRREIAERKDAERRLRQRERQLADAQQVARVGSWEWLVPEDRVTWSDEMFRIHGYRPREFSVTFDRAVELVVDEDLPRIRQDVATAFRKARDHDLPPSEYRIRRTDGVERVLLGKSKLKVDPAGRPLRLVGTVQDITEDKLAEREHRIAETLQRSFLPDILPEIPGVMLAARYVPATTDVEVGGDWYDVLQLANGRVGVAIGDVAGHGLRAASAMAQLRMALRAYAVEEDTPVDVVRRLHQLVQRLPLDEMATLIYLVFDPDSGTVTFANAGHPPPLVIGPDGATMYLEDGLAPPLGTPAHPDHYLESASNLPAGSTLLLFTDGLIEKRGDSLRHGLARLTEEASKAGPDLDTLCNHLLDSLLGRDVSDDIALLALRLVPFGDKPLVLRVPAEPRVLAPIRHTLRRWLREHEATAQDVNDILVASGEACSNAIQHAYGPVEGTLEITLALLDGEVELTIRDWGTWRPTSPAQGGRGMHLMLGLMDNVDVDSRSEGTVVRMRRRLGRRAPS
jgi:PAS domain S-box-containing protein